MSITERIVHTTRADICVRETAGSGMPVVLVHGSGASGRAFARQMEGPIGEAWRMIALDLPGHGRSADAVEPARDYTIAGIAGILSEALDAIAPGRHALLGWSLGGHVAIELMAARRDVAGVMLCGTPPLGRGPLAPFRAFRTSWDLMLGSKERYTEKDARRLLDICYGDSADLAFLEDIRRADGRLRATVVRSMMRGDGVDQKRAVEHAGVPVAMINGSEEPMARLSYIEGLDIPTLWEGRCHTIAGAGHSPFWQAPERFNVLLHRFATSVAIGVQAPVAPAEMPTAPSDESRRAG
jgi:pimeloyl-ACP methyl ester carboxylesterase